MKSILTILFSFLFIVSGFSQTRNVVVDTNGVVVQPTNIWTANATNARSGLGLGTAATNPASAFQPSSAVLSNLASSNAVNLTNLRATNIIGVIPSSNIPTVNLTNIGGTLAIVSGGTGATNADGARTNLGLGATWLTNTNVTNFRTAIGLGTGANVSIGDDGGSLTTDDFNAGNVNVSTAVTFTTNSAAALTRTNLGLGWPALTNSNAGTGLVSVNTNGVVVSPTNFWQVAPIQTLVQSSAPNTNSTNAATNARNLYYYSLATNIINVTNTITLPTNTSAFEGDEVTVIHRGGSNSVTAVRQLGSTNNLISLNSYDEAVKFIKDGSWDFYHNISYTEAIRFSGTNASANAAESRTNLGLGWSALTNTNAATSLLGFTTNGQVVANTGTNVLTFGNFVSDTIYSSTLGSYIQFDEATLRLGSTNGYIALESYLEFNNTTTAATTRTNLGLPLAALTNTSTTNFQKAIFHTNTAPSNIGGNLGSIAAWIEIVASNGVTYKIPAYTNVP